MQLTTVLQTENSTSIILQVEADAVMQIGDQLAQLHPAAYMNGYNWDALLTHYLQQHHPELTQDMGSDPEAGMHVFYYPVGANHLAHAQQVEQIISTLLQNPEQLYDFVQKEGDAIPWD